MKMVPKRCPLLTTQGSTTHIFKHDFRFSGFGLISSFSHKVRAIILLTRTVTNQRVVCLHASTSRTLV